MSFKLLLRDLDEEEELEINYESDSSDQILTISATKKDA